MEMQCSYSSTSARTLRASGCRFPVKEDTTGTAGDFLSQQNTRLVLFAFERIGLLVLADTS